MNTIVENYIARHDQGLEHTPVSILIEMLKDIWKSASARKAWLEHYEKHPHQQWSSLSYDYILQTKEFQTLNRDVPIEQRYQLATVLAQEDVFDSIALHALLDVPIKAKTIQACLKTAPSAVHLKKLIPIEQSPAEEQIFTRLLQEMDLRHVDSHAQEWLPIFWYALNHQNMDIRTAVAAKLIERLDSSPKVFAKIVPKEQNDNPGQPYRCWQPHPKTKLKIVQKYLPDLEESYLFYQNALNFSSTKALSMARENQKQQQCAVQELSLDWKESYL